MGGPRRRVLIIRLRRPEQLIARDRGNPTRSRYEGPLTVRNGFRHEGKPVPNPPIPWQSESGEDGPVTVSLREAHETDWPAIYPIFVAVIATGQT